MKNSERRVLVTGGLGFIGSYLVDTLLAAHRQCTVIDSKFHKDYSHAAHLEGRIALYEDNIADAVRLDRIFEETQPQDVYHLAAHHFIPYCDNHPTDAIGVNIIGTQNVADSCARFGVENLFVASTAAVYGPSDAPHRETERATPMDIYATTKFAAERIGWILTRRSPVRVRVGRYFNAVGSRETNPHIVPEIIEQLRGSISHPRLRLGNIFPKRDYIHASDLAEASFAVVNANTAESFDVVNIGSGKEYSVSDLVGFFSREIGCPIPIEVDKARLRKVDRPHLCASIEKIAHVYGWYPKRGLTDTIRELAGLCMPAPQVT
jgi:UDP-glucose 4-epimerase